MEEQPVYAYEFEGTRYDAGTTMGWLKASVELALAAARPRRANSGVPPSAPTWPRSETVRAEGAAPDGRPTACGTMPRGSVPDGRA